MSEQLSQNFSNHAKLVPAFHFFLLPVLFANLISSLLMAYRILTHARPLSVWVIVAVVISVLLAVALVVLATLARLFALGVQDRVIRLEERLRFQQLLPADLQPRISEFTINQFVSLRFASDEELPALARKVLDSKINSRKAIKQMIQNWRADYQRI